MTQHDRMETITDPALIRATDEPDERGDFPCCTTPAPSSGAGPCGNATDRLPISECQKRPEGCPCFPASGAGLDLDALPRLARLVLVDALDRAESAEAEVGTLRAKVAAVEAHASRLAASLALTLYDAHPVYGSTALWHGGVGGQAITAHCAIINGGPPGMEWADGYLPSMALSEFIAATPGFDLDAAKAAMLTDLRAALATTGEGQ